MSDNDRPLVVDLDFETAVGETARALHEEGLELVARIDVRDQFRIALRHDFRRYTLLEAWSPALTLEALQHDLTIGTNLPVTLAIYELADGQTALIATDRLSQMRSMGEWHRRPPEIASVADDQAERIARVLGRVLQRARRSPVAPAA